MATRKRSRSSGATSSAMRRTTSLSELAPPTRAARGRSAAAATVAPPVETGAGAGLSAAQRRHSLDGFPVTETAAFLKACGLCNRRLGPGRDTFIYMGEVAFCSHECRQQQMNIDELKEKKRFTPAGGGSGVSDQSGNSSTIAAA
ncbi:uncharacterized protein LOC133926523 [Phragmites australis]|uniref:uncharacterized protein LOC133926523 n=1 Tax=Phragmites australis TaxID=29695 RepID=UPI002D798EE1|nr:uncharacterized protein LOC133926523 [Phragmites australis]